MTTETTPQALNGSQIADVIRKCRTPHSSSRSPGNSGNGLQGDDPQLVPPDRFGPVDATQDDPIGCP